MNRKQKETVERMYGARESREDLDALFGEAGPAALAELAEKVKARDFGGKDWLLGDEAREWMQGEFLYETARYAVLQDGDPSCALLAGTCVSLYLSGYDLEELAGKFRKVMPFADRCREVAGTVGYRLDSSSSGELFLPLGEIAESVQRYMVENRPREIFRESQYAPVRLKMLGNETEVPEEMLNDPDGAVREAAAKQAALEEFSVKDLSYNRMDQLLGRPRDVMPDAFPMVFRALAQKERADLVAGRAGNNCYQLGYILPMCSDADLALAAGGRFGLDDYPGESGEYYTEKGLILEMLGRGNPEINAALASYRGYNGHWEKLAEVFGEDPGLASEGMRAQIAVELAEHAREIPWDDPLVQLCRENREFQEDAAISAAVQKFDGVKQHQLACQEKYREYERTLAREIGTLKSFAEDLARFTGNWGSGITELMERSGGSKEALCESIDSQIQGYAVRLKGCLEDPDMAEWKGNLLDAAGTLRKVHDCVARMPDRYEFYSHFFDQQFAEVMLECMADPGYADTHPAAAWVMENSMELNRGVNLRMIPEEVRLGMVCEGWCLELLEGDPSVQVREALAARDAFEVRDVSKEGLEDYLSVHGAYITPVEPCHMEEAEEFRQDGTPIVDGSKYTRIAYVQGAGFGKSEDLDMLVRDASQGVKEALVSKGYRDEVEIAGGKMEYAAARFDSALLTYKFCEAVGLMQEAAARGEDPFAGVPGDVSSLPAEAEGCAGFAAGIQEELGQYSKDAAALFGQCCQGDYSVKGIFGAVQKAYEAAVRHERELNPEAAHESVEQGDGLSAGKIRERLAAGKEAEFKELYGKFAGQEQAVEQKPGAGRRKKKEMDR